MRFNSIAVASLAGAAWARPILDAEIQIVEPIEKRQSLSGLEDLTKTLPVGDLTKTLPIRQLESVESALSSLTGNAKRQDLSALEDLTKELPVRQLESLTEELSSLTGNIKRRDLSAIEDFTKKLTARQLESLESMIGSLTGSSKRQDLSALEDLTKSLPVRQLEELESTIESLTGSAKRQLDLGSLTNPLETLTESIKRQLVSVKETIPTTGPATPIIPIKRETPLDIVDNTLTQAQPARQSALPTRRTPVEMQCVKDASGQCKPSTPNANHTSSSAENVPEPDILRTMEDTVSL